MADFKEEIAKIEELAKEDEQFHNEYTAAVESKDLDRIVAFLTSNGFEATAKELRAQAEDAREIDEAELDAVAGGAAFDGGEYSDFTPARRFLCSMWAVIGYFGYTTDQRPIEN